MGFEQAAKKEPAYADFLDELLSCEVDARRTRYLRARLQLAHLPFLKTFDQFDFGFQPSIDERQIRELRTLREGIELAGTARQSADGNDWQTGNEMRTASPTVTRR
jgi:DNA replication protein DnaC